jgi:hypothetical protein
MSVHAKSRMLEEPNRLVKNQVCARICARDAGGRAETGETQQIRDDFAAYACHGGLLETLQSEYLQVSI